MVDVHRWWFGVLPYWLYQRKMPEDATGKADVVERENATLQIILRRMSEMKDVIQKTLTAGTETEFERAKENDANG